MTNRVPKNKRVLNTHISVAEHAFLKGAARANAMTVTMYLRNLIRREMVLAKTSNPADSGTLTTTRRTNYQG